MPLSRCAIWKRKALAKRDERRLASTCGPESPHLSSERASAAAELVLKLFLKLFVICALSVPALFCFAAILMIFIVGGLASGPNGGPWWFWILFSAALALPAVIGAGLLRLVRWLVRNPRYHPVAALSITFTYIVVAAVAGPANLRQFAETVSGFPQILIMLTALPVIYWWAHS